MDQVSEENSVKDFALDLCNEEVAPCMDSTEVRANITSEKTARNIKSKNAQEKMKTLNAKAKYMTVDLLPQRKILKRKTVHPPTSVTIMDSIKALKTRMVSSFRNMKAFVKEKCAIYISVIKNCVNKLLQRGANNGILKDTDKANAEEKSKIKKLESIKNDTQNSSQKETIEEPPTSEMMINSIKTLKKCIATSFSSIRKHMKEKYSINRKELKTCVLNDTDNGVFNSENKFDNKVCQIDDSGVDQKIGRASIEEKSERNKTENIMDSKEEKEKSGKKIAVNKKKYLNLFVVFIGILLLLVVKANLDRATPCNRKIKSSRAR